MCLKHNSRFTARDTHVEWLHNLNPSSTGRYCQSSAYEGVVIREVATYSTVLPLLTFSIGGHIFYKLAEAISYWIMVASYIGNSTK